MPLDVSLEFLLPEFDAALGCVGIFAARMTVPETPVYKDYSPVFRQNNVWFSREILMKTETITHPVQKGSYILFWLSTR